MNKTHIISFINTYYNTNILSESRKAEITIPRYMCIKILYDHDKHKFNYSMLARLFNKKQHGTIKNGLKIINNIIQFDKQVCKDYTIIKNHIDNLIEKEDYTKYENILNKYCKIGMIKWNIEEFKITHEKLYKCIMFAMKEINNK